MHSTGCRGTAFHSDKEIEARVLAQTPSGDWRPGGALKITCGRHVAAQEKASRRFLELSGGENEPLFEAHFRLTRVLALRAEPAANNPLREDSDALLDPL